MGFPCLPKGRRQYIPQRCPYPTQTLAVGGYPPEPSIKNIKAWLDWQAHQLDMPHWWVELTAISNVENPKELARKIHASFLIPTVRCEASLGQGYTASPTPKCLTRNMFLPNDLSYQDICQQPLLLTVAYAQVLQYWAEKFRLPVHPDYYPLAMSVVELMQCVREHITFYKQDVLQDLGTQPTTRAIGSMELNSAEAWGSHDATPLLLGPPPQVETPPVKLTAPSTVDNVRHIPPSLVNPQLEGDATVLSTTPEGEAPKDLLTGQAISLIETVAPVVPTMASVV